MSYRRVVLGPQPGLDSWTYETVERAPLLPHEVRVRVHATSLNYRDLLVATGQYGGTYPAGLVPLSDGAGEVIECGPQVTAFKPGDRIAANFFRDWADGDLTPERANSAMGGAVDGMLAEEVVLPETSLVTIPGQLTFSEAACLPCAGLTAWRALFELGQLRPGQTVLLQGTGGVSIFALQFAKAAGARVHLISSSDERLERARQLGADTVTNYRTEPDWAKSVRKATQGAGVDLVLEVGGRDTLPQSLKVVRTGGRIVAIGLLSGASVEFNIGFLLTKNLTLQGVYVGSVASFRAMNAAISATGIRPVIGTTGTFDRAGEMLRNLQEGGHFGKQVITFD